MELYKVDVVTGEYYLEAEGVINIASYVKSVA